MKAVFSLVFLCFSVFAHAQQDTIFFGNEKLIVTVKEVGEESIKYTYPGEDIINSIYKNSVSKISYRSGRVQIFREAVNFHPVNSVSEWERVSISQLESEVKGLFKVGDVSAKAKGGTALTGEARVKDRAFKKLKIRTAMLGGNVIYMTQLDSKGNQYNSWMSQSAEANLSAIAYSNVLPQIDEFNKLISGKKSFKLTERLSLRGDGVDVSSASIDGVFHLVSVSNQNGHLYVTGKINNGKETDYRVVRFNEQTFSLFYKDKATLYNFIFKF